MHFPAHTTYGTRNREPTEINLNNGTVNRNRFMVYIISEDDGCKASSGELPFHWGKLAHLVSRLTLRKGRTKPGNPGAWRDRKIARSLVPSNPTALSAVRRKRNREHQLGYGDKGERSFGLPSGSPIGGGVTQPILHRQSGATF